MAEFYMGQIMMTAFGFPPRFFAQCNGGQMSVTQNAALFALLGTQYGGDGRATFNLPDLRGRAAVAGGFPSQSATWQPTPYPIAATGGVEQVALTGDQNAQHTHAVAATSTAGTSSYLDGNMTLAATGAGATVYGTAATLLALGGGPTSSMGAGAPHDNMQPFEVINFNIALSGIFPSRG